MDQQKRLLRDFLVPRLDENTYGHKLHWIDRQKGLFRIFWKHQSSGNWTIDDAEVFIDWAIFKNSYNENDPKRASKMKQRFKSAISKLNTIEMFIDEHCGDYRVCIIKEDIPSLQRSLDAAVQHLFQEFRYGYGFLPENDVVNGTEDDLLLLQQFFADNFYDSGNV